MADDDVEETAGRPRSTLRIAGRIVLVVGALALSGFVLVNAFDELDPQEILDALRSLDDAEIISLFAMWMLWIAAQGLQTASLITGLPVRRGVLAFLAPAAVASVVPGPSDLPVRYRMLTGWGRDRTEATLAVGAGGLFSIGIKLVLPVIAAIGLLVSDAPIDGTLRTIVVIALVVGAVLVAVAVVLGSADRTARVGQLIAPVWRVVLRLMRRPDPVDFATRLVEARTMSLELVRDRWPMALWGTSLTAGARFALLLMAVRFTGVPEEIVSWPQVFVVYALVQGLTVIPLTAGDAGVSEVAYIGLLTAAAGRDWVNEITAAVILFRLLTWVIIIPVGLGAFVVWHRSMDDAPAARS